MTQLTGAQRLEIAEQSLLRINSIIDFASVIGCGDHESPDGDLDDLFSELLAGDRRGFDKSVDTLFKLADSLDEDFKDSSELGLLMQDKNVLGYAVQFSTPVRKETGSCSWGSCYLRWFYGDTIDEVWGLAQQWATEEAQKNNKEN